MRLRVAHLPVLLALSLYGCAKHPSGAPQGWPARTEWIVNGRTGTPSTFQAMVDDLAGADVVFVGEDHDNPFHHDVQRRLLAALAERKPGLGLGMEMLQRHSQPAADLFTRGMLDTDGLAKQVDWPRTWGFPFALYRPILEVARARSVPLFALNADEQQVHRVSKVGLAGLTEEEKAALPELDLSSEAYREYVRQAFGGHHAMAPEAFERFFSAQVLWDETMASRTVDAMHAADPARPMFVMAGIGHLIQRMGIPSRVERRSPGVRTRVVLPLAAGPRDHPDFKKSAAEKEADWIWVTPDVEDTETAGNAPPALRVSAR